MLALLHSYRHLAVFLGAFFFGDSVLFTIAYLGGQQSWPMAPVVVAAFLGTALADTLWYALGCFGAGFMNRVPYLQSEREKAAALLHQLLGENPALALIFLKFLYGSRIAMILYVAARGIGFWRFSAYNALGIAAWLLVFFPVGYLTGTGVAQAFPVLNSVQAGIVVLIVSFIALRLLSIWLTRRVEA